MGQIKIILPNEVEIAFRKAAMQRFGYQRGAISKAAESAMKQWTSANEELIVRAKKPLTAFFGILKHINKSSVELQHEAWDSVVEKHVHRH